MQEQMEVIRHDHVRADRYVHIDASYDKQWEESLAIAAVLEDLSDGDCCGPAMEYVAARR
ncbi:MAG TPA: hypothetical protein VNM92_14080 [Thermoanaerobaculia bacterium]|nr:hypothetical protein [Thermoanaerobaculia bacterium]